jgi:hypothetical protein
MARKKMTTAVVDYADQKVKKSAAKTAAAFGVAIVACGFGWIGDLHWNVAADRKAERGWVLLCQWLGYVFWPSVSLFLITRTGVVALPVMLFAAWVITLRLCAAVGVSLRPGQFIKVWTKHISSPLRWGLLVLLGIIVPVAAALLKLPSAVFTLWVSWVLWIGISHWVSLDRAGLELQDRELKRQFAPKLAVVFRISAAQFETASKMRLEKETGALILNPAPAGAVANRGDVEAQLAHNMSKWELDTKRSNEDQLVLIPVSLETAEKRLSLVQTGGLTEGEETVSGAYSPERQRAVSIPDSVDLSTVEGHAKFHAMVQKKLGGSWEIEEIRDGKACLVKATPALRPAHKIWPLKDGKGEKEMSILARNKAARDGLSLVEWDWDQKAAHVANTLPAVRALRARIANRIGCEAHDLELRAAFGYDTEGNGILSSVEVIRDGGRITGAQEKRVMAWFEVATFTVGALGWKAHEDRSTGHMVLTYGVPRKLPALVPMTDLMPAEQIPADWFSLPLGVDADGKVCKADLKLGPHAMIAGPTGSGKTILLLQIMMSALARGHRVVLADSAKGGVDFEHLRPYCSGWVENLPDTAEMITSLYAEVTRRKAVLKEYGVGNWAKLPEAVRHAENIHPISFFLDEYFSVIVEVKISPLMKETELGAELAEQNLQKAIIATYVGKLAREARFVGIHLYLAMQRPDATVIGGELRSNLTTAIQLTKPGALPSRTALEMIFTGDQVNAAAEELGELDDGKSLGLAVMAAEGGGVAGFRVGFAEAEDLPTILEALGVPLATPWSTQPANTLSPLYTQAYSMTKDAVAEIVDLGEMELDMGDLELELEGDDEVDMSVIAELAAPVPVVAPVMKISSGNPLARKAALGALAAGEDAFGGRAAPMQTRAIVDDADPFGAPALEKARPATVWGDGADPFA